MQNEPKDKKAWIRLGLAHSKNNELSSALEAFENVNQIDPNDLEMIANRITILTDLGRFDEAEGLIETLNSNQKLQADVAQATAGLLLSQKKLVEATTLFQHVCRERPHIASYWLNWAAALRGLRRTVTPYGVLKRGLCHVPNDEDLQEALQQILAEMARPEAVARCRKLWPRTNEDLKTSYLFSRQFLGIGTAAGIAKHCQIRLDIGNRKVKNINFTHFGLTPSLIR